MIRFGREFHQSDIEQFKPCPRMLYYREVIEIDPERASEQALASIAMYKALARAHADKRWDPNDLFALWRETFEHSIAKALGAGLRVQRGYVDLEDYHPMLRGHASQPWNRKAEVILSERELFFEIMPAKTLYQFAGRVDQVIRLLTPLVAVNLPLFQHLTAPQVTILQDLKTGHWRGTSPFELVLNDQISIYTCALKYGNFDLDDDGIWERHVDLIPHFHALYFLQDHIPYKRPPKDNPTQSRGSGVYFTRRPLERLLGMPRALMPSCASIRRGDFPRQGSARGLCEKDCSVRHYCEADLLQEIGERG
jgi:hypothetical protein